MGSTAPLKLAPEIVLAGDVAAITVGVSFGVTCAVGVAAEVGTAVCVDVAAEAAVGLLAVFATAAYVEVAAGAAVGLLAVVGAAARVEVAAGTVGGLAIAGKVAGSILVGAVVGITVGAVRVRVGSLTAAIDARLGVPVALANSINNPPHTTTATASTAPRRSSCPTVGLRTGCICLIGGPGRRPASARPPCRA